MERITKFRIFENLEKEEAFINKMNQDGWKLEFVQFGCIFKFLKTDEEYFTTICATEKSQTLQMTSGAVLSGYEVIPHSFDGMSNFIYLTGRKDTAYKDFFSDNASKLVHYKNIKNYYRIQALIPLICGLIFSLIAAIPYLPATLKILSNLDQVSSETMQEILPAIILVFTMLLLGLSLICYSAYIFSLYAKNKIKYTKLLDNMNLYE
ncbi:MAG: DUF2812 domain-containing protein [Ruminococcaceae bacterium]|nr:DUF2812 domain-containing protein [Oscillospiraceae bacterium]